MQDRLGQLQRAGKPRLAGGGSGANRLCFLLSCGYFKASKHFFPTRTFHTRDIEYVAGRTELRLDEIKLDSYPKGTSSRHQEFILNFCGFRISLFLCLPLASPNKLAIQKRIE